MLGLIISNLLFWTILNTASVAKAETPPEVHFDKIEAVPLKQEKALSFADLKNKVVIVDFWASWCEPCKEALPHYAKLYEKYKSKGLVILAINEDDDLKERDQFLKIHPLPFAVFADTEKKMVRNFKVVALPTLYIFNKQLKPVGMYRGFDEKKTPELEKKIQELLESSP